MPQVTYFQFGARWQFTPLLSWQKRVVSGSPVIMSEKLSKIVQLWCGRSTNSTGLISRVIFIYSGLSLNNAV
jgi:hypothetical protein